MADFQWSLLVGGALGPSLAPQVRASRGLFKLLKPVADAYSNLAGYRRMGLKYDDILIEETPVVQKVSNHSLPPSLPPGLPSDPAQVGFTNSTRHAVLIGWFVSIDRPLAV